MVTGTPHPALRGIVLRYEGYAVRDAAPASIRELPCTYVPFIIELDSHWTITHVDAQPVRLGSFVAGITANSVMVSHGGSAQCLQVDLTPVGARRLIGSPMSELANRTVPFDDVLGRFGRDLVQRIGDTADWTQRFRIVDTALLTRLDDAPPIDAGLAWSLSQIRSSGGTASVGELASVLGWSHRRFIATYRDAVGLPPKLISRITRFERLSAQVSGLPRVDWAALAVDCGYFDQAHMVSDVRELAGCTPTELWGG